MVEFKNDTRLISDSSDGGRKRYRIEKTPRYYGGMATVHYGVDEVTEREIVAKFMEYHCSEMLFEGEAQACAKLSHPNILRVFDLIREDNRLAIISEYIDSPTLEELLENGNTIKLEDAVKICDGVANAVDYAYKHEVMHGDVKPANIMVNEEEVILIDWGLAKAKLLFEGDYWPRTPAYSSPEKTLGLPDIGLPSEVFGLAIVMFEAIVGSMPFGVSGSDHSDIEFEILSKDFNVEKLGFFPDGVREKLEIVFKRALSKNPEDRYQTCTEFAIAFKNAAIEDKIRR